MSAHQHGLMTVETGLGPESACIPTYSLKIDGKPAFVASIFAGNSGENAQRMAACWNACAGLDVDLLARFGLGTATGSSICRLREQNAELIAMLKTIVLQDDRQCLCQQTIEHARSLIKKVEQQ
jgi:hypothetical protein